MNIHEYQAKSLMKEAGLTILDSVLADTVEEAVRAAESLKSEVKVVKAQVHAGGRGKAGGIKLCKSLDEVRKASEELLGTTLVTAQTGVEGKPINSVLIESGCNIEKEFYVAILLNRKQSRLNLILSSEGGMDIEEVAKKTPDKIQTVSIDPQSGLTEELVKKATSCFDLSQAHAAGLQKAIKLLYKIYTQKDATLIEINPLVFTKEGDAIPLDGKFNFDENALFRHPEISAFYDPKQEAEAEAEAQKYGFSFVKLDGTIGCLVNGAGLAMATMDMIQLEGEMPANFLDVGGSADEQKVADAFGLILKDPNVKGIFINIFGGIMKCDIIANGVVGACKKMNLQVPLVGRIKGTNVKEGMEILEKSGLNLHPAKNLSEGSKLIVSLIKGGK